MQILIGSVLKNKNTKTLLVGVPYVVTHPLYHKQIKRTSKLQVHNEIGEVAVGSKVKIGSCNPVSKNKSFKLLEILEETKIKETETSKKIEIVKKDVKKGKVSKVAKKK